jgi:hypothetical protein
MADHVAKAELSIDHAASRVLDAFEQEFWSGRHCLKCLAAAPIRAAFDGLLDNFQPPLPPPAVADGEHERLYGEALSSWAQLNNARFRLDALLCHLEEKTP